MGIWLPDISGWADSASSAASDAKSAVVGRVNDAGNLVTGFEDAVSSVANSITGGVQAVSTAVTVSEVVAGAVVLVGGIWVLKTFGKELLEIFR